MGRSSRATQTPAGKKPAPILFHYFRTTFRLKRSKASADWLIQVARKEGVRIGTLSYVFCTDSYLLSINQDYLHHDTYTDIITFDLSDSSTELEGEIYISVPRVRENARNLGVDFDSELHRVMVHGLLHLSGHSDKTRAQKDAMRKSETSYLSLR